MRIDGNDVVKGVTQYHSDKAKAELVIVTLISAILASIGVFLIGENIRSKGKNCLLPDFLCKLPMYVHMIVLGCIIIGAILHLVALVIAKNINEQKDSEDEIKKKLKTVDNLKTAGHVLLAPLYIAIILICLYIAANLAGK